MNEIVPNEEQIDSGLVAFPNQIRGIIVDLRSVISQINVNQKHAKELILELARRMDELQLCQKDEISRRIKDILKDKIDQDQITAKWIEECLPQEYKRKYNKSELSSLSTVGRENISVQQLKKEDVGSKEAKVEYDNHTLASSGVKSTEESKPTIQNSLFQICWNLNSTCHSEMLVNIWNLYIRK
jgi:hypothetical protein